MPKSKKHSKKINKKIHIDAKNTNSGIKKKKNISNDLILYKIIC